MLFHEACGHGLEADAIGKDTTVYARTRGDKIGSELFSGVDDPTLPGAWGSYGFDDEGIAATRTTLFDAGVQAGVMSDRISAHRLGTESTGHGRRQSYAHVPLPRMSNSLVLPGTSDPASLISDVKQRAVLQRARRRRGQPRDRRLRLRGDRGLPHRER